MKPQTWEDQFRLELSQAENARRSGLEGQARVCARRAAGVVLREYVRRREPGSTERNAYALISLFSEDGSLPAEARRILKILQMRTLPGGASPVEEDMLALVGSLPGLLQLDDYKKEIDE